MITTGFETVDLHVDAVYGGSTLKHAGADPLPKLLGVDSGAGFRVLGKRASVESLRMVVLKTSFSSAVWPDSLDSEMGVFIYYGDRLGPGGLHDTARGGNMMLRNLFGEAHGTTKSNHFPPILLFGATGKSRDVRFLGLAVPGADGLSGDEDLVAVWRIKDGERFQNYKATFTILDVPVVSREWIRDVQQGHAVGSLHAPAVWLKWVRGRKLTPLKAEPAQKRRLKQEQLPSSHLQPFLRAVYDQFKTKPHAFERCAIEIFKMLAPSVASYDVTRPWRDGGRDVLGKYRIGQSPASVDVDFALEAKCYGESKGVGVRELSRLLSRLRHRQFGILVTTSYLAKQAYDEIIDDAHPIIVVSGGDIAEQLYKKFENLEALGDWLASFM